MAIAADPQYSATCPKQRLRVAGIMKTLVFGLLALLGWSGSAFAQYRLDVWTTEHGLPQNVVRALAQARDGYLWVVTMDGVARFDGVRFTVFDRGNTPAMRTNRYVALYESGGDLWFGSEAGVARYHDGTFTAYATEHGLPDPLVTGVTGDANGHIWVLASDRIVKWAKDRFVPEAAAAGTSFTRSRWRSDVFFGSDGRRIYRFADGRLTSRPLPDSVRRRSDARFAEDDEGRLWMGLADGGIAVIGSDGGVREYRDPPDPEAARYSATDPHILHRDVQGRVWTIRLDRRLSRFVLIPTAAGVETVRVDALYEDRDRNLWLATYNRGLCRVANQAVRVLPASPGPKPGNVYPVLQDSHGAMWAGVWDVGLGRFEHGHVTYFTRSDGLASSHPTALAEDAAGRIWVAGHEAPNAGLQVIEHGRIRDVMEPRLPDRTVVSAIHHDAAGGLWLGTNHGLLRYANGASTLYTTAEGLAGDEVKAIVAGREGTLWIGTNGGLSLFRDERLTSWTERDGLPNSVIRALHLDADGVLWIGTYDAGIARMKDGRLTRLTARDGLFDDGAFQILETPDGFLWVSCNRGIYRIDKAEASAFAEGRVRGVHALALGSNDGLVNAEANGGTWPAGVAARDGTLWFPTQAGLAIVDPRAISADVAPIRTVIESLRVDREPVALADRIVIEPGQRTFELQYTALSFVSPEQIRFRYMMDGLDADWQDAGTRRAAYYSYLPPGHYEFRVAASNAGGVWSTPPATLAIEVRPPYWRTWWFATIVTSGVGFIGMGAYRRRVTSVERARSAQETFSRQLIASQEQERARIAGELHDSLGQSLIVICNWAALGTAVIEPAAPGREELEEIERAARRAVDEVRSIAHSLGTYDLEHLGLADSLGEMVERVRRSSQIAIVTELPTVDHFLPRDATTSLYRVAQEAMNNIVRHAGATKVTVRLRRAPPGLVTLTVTDNGKGFDPDAARAGFGLSDMAARVRLFDGEFSLRSSPGAGTTIEVRMKGGGDEAR